jgi:hypothetical protein
MRPGGRVNKGIHHHAASCCIGTPSKHCDRIDNSADMI